MKNAVAVTLTKSESAEFTKFDATIKTGAKTFLEVGRALVAVHDGKLYREEFTTFQQYAESRGLKRAQAYKLMSAVQLTLELVNVSPGDTSKEPVSIEDVAKSSGKAVNALGRAPRSKRREIFHKASKKSGGAPTEKDIIDVTAEVTHQSNGKSEPEDPAEIAQPKPLTPEQFEAEVKALEARIPANANHDKYGAVLNAAAMRQMNFGNRKVSLSAYT